MDKKQQIMELVRNMPEATEWDLAEIERFISQLSDDELDSLIEFIKWVNSIEVIYIKPGKCVPDISLN